MKQNISCILILTMLLTLLSGCGTHQEAAETVSPANDTAAAEAAPQDQISTVDEFLAALKSETEITLAPGTYDLTAASDYGKASEVYSWNEETGALWISNLHELTIHGNGAEIIVDSEKGMPLVFDSCQDLHLENLTLAHRDPKETGRMPTWHSQPQPAGEAHLRREGQTFRGGNPSRPDSCPTLSAFFASAWRGAATGQVRTRTGNPGSYQTP